MSDGTEFELPDADAPVAEAAAPAAAETPAVPAGEQTETAEEAAAAAEKAAKAQELKAAVEHFVETVKSSLGHEGRDDETGNLPEAAIAPVKVAFSQLPTSRAKTLAANFLRDSMTNAMLEEEDTKARSLQMLYKAVNAIVAVKKEAAIRIPVSPDEAHADAVAMLAMAANLLVPGEGVTDGWRALAGKKIEELKADKDTYYAWLVENNGKADADKSPAPTVNALVVKAAAIASAKGGRVKKAAANKPAGVGTGRGRPVGSKNHSMRAHLLEVFAGKNVGDFVPLEDVVNFKSNEYGDDPIQNNSVIAHLVPPSGKTSRSADLFKLVQAGENGAPSRGVMKIA